MINCVGKKPYHHGDLEQALVAAALETIREDGVEALTLRGVGAKIGVSRTALYRHFEDKAALLARVSLEGFRLLRSALQESISPPATPYPAGMEDMAVAYVEFARENPAHYRTMFGRAIGDWSKYPALIAEGEAAFGVLFHAVAAGQAAGAIRRGDPLQVAQVIWAMVHGVAMLTIDGKLNKIDPHGEVRKMARFSAECLTGGIGTGQLH